MGFYRTEGGRDLLAFRDGAIPDGDLAGALEDDGAHHSVSERRGSKRVGEKLGSG